MKDFSQTNQLLEQLVSRYPSEILSGVSNAVTRVGQRVYNGINEYSMLYAQQQLLKYDADGNPDDVTTTERQSIADAALANCKREGQELISTYKAQLDQLPQVTQTVEVSAAVDTSERILWFSTFTIKDTYELGDILKTVGKLLIGYRVGLEPGFVFKYVERQGSANGVIDFSDLIPYEANPLLALIAKWMVGTFATEAYTFDLPHAFLAIPQSGSVNYSGNVQSGLTSFLVTTDKTSDGFFRFRLMHIAKSTANIFGGIESVNSEITPVFNRLPLDGSIFTLNDVWAAIRASYTRVFWTLTTEGVTALSGGVDQLPDEQGFAVDLDGGTSGVINTAQTVQVTLDGYAIPDQSDIMQGIIDSL